MKLLYDLNSLRPPRSGVGYYTQHLLEGLFERDDIEDIGGWVGSNYYDRGGVTNLVSGKDALQAGAQFSEGWKASLLRAARTVPGVYHGRTVVRRIKSSSLRAEYARRGFIYHETNFVASPYAGPNVVTIHDLSHRRFPEFHPQAAVDYLDRNLPDTLKQAYKVIADSEYTRRDTIEIYGLPEDKVVAIPLGVEPCFRPHREEECESVLAELGLRHRGFILSVCTLQPRKNLPRLVTAFAKLPADMREAFPLVLIGADGWMNTDLMRDMERLAKAKQIIAPGYVVRESLLKLYASAAVFAYPSLFEGFGLPVAEAMASGVAVLTSNVTSLPEVTAGAALEVDPRSVDDIAAGLERLLNDEALRDALVVKGLARASELTWDETVRRTCDVYRSIAA
ncbi:glycosyltransferase family 4 protein [Paraburkholderia terrae]|uniref:Glycosyltransferase family 1 protein n=1 Tax=Paraburkholderia terrae TaxID=311230 RepID=A0A2I8EKX9_9BURK|nr:glycosyltransferase family 1 protein [Paraburkholderia terrae]AUT60257.1 glycosyltransferase family 1 protein [Paraburkholderia terrae]